VAHSIVLEHDATIDVTSVPGSGAEFRITFGPRPTPLKESRPPGARISSAPSGGNQGPAGGASSEGR
jgi:hypothetical protein